MKILLLGGTGAMGSHLSEILASDKFNQIFVTTRSLHHNEDNLTYISGNAHDEKFLDEIIKDHWDVIVDFMVYSTEELRNRINKLLVSCNQYVFLSSSRVYADSKTPITENSPRLLDSCKDEEYIATDEYALTKARQENILRESEYSNWTIIRPYITFAENRLQLGVLELQHWLYRALLDHTIVFSKDISERYTILTYGYDVARGIAALIGNKKALGEAFHITFSNPLKWSEILNIYLDIIEKKTGKRPNVKIVPEHPYINDDARKYQVIYDRRYDRIFDNSKIGEFIDINTFLSTENGIKKALEYFIDHYDSKQFKIDAVHEAIYDRLAGEKMNLKVFDSKKNKLKYILFRYFNGLVPIARKIKNLIR